MTVAFRRLGQPKPLYETIADEIESMVVDGILKPDDVLPSEQELARRFGVSRTAVREAIKVLSQRQLVFVTRGKSAVIASPSSAGVTASLTLLFRLTKIPPLDLTEVRRILEPELAALAAVRAGPEHVAAIREAIAQYEARVAGVEDVATLAEDLAALEVAFHGSVAAAAQNKVAKAMLDSVQQLHLESTLAGYKERVISPTVTASHHASICRAIENGDAAAARELMLEHMGMVIQYQRALGGQMRKME